MFNIRGMGLEAKWTVSNAQFTEHFRGTSTYYYIFISMQHILSFLLYIMIIILIVLLLYYYYIIIKLLRILLLYIIIMIIIIIICRVCHLPSLFVNSINFPALSTERRTLQAEGRVHQHDASAAVSTKSFLTHQNSEIVPKMLPSGFFNIAMERSTIFNGQFSMAMLYNQRVNVPKDPSSDVRRSCCTDCLARA